MSVSEDYFPRGGKKPNHEFQSVKFLGNLNIGEKIRRRNHGNRRNDNDDNDSYDGNDSYDDNDSYDNNDLTKSEHACIEGLSYKSIREGMAIVGRIQQIFETKVIVALPCQLSGVVMVNHISEPYNGLLQSYINNEIGQVQSLFNIFTIGEYVIVKVMQVTKQPDEKCSILLSMLPQHVNSGVSQKQLNPGVLLRGAVNSKEDHGYVIDIGVTNCTAFLPKNLLEAGKKIEIGQLIWCAVNKTASENRVVTVSNEIDKLKRSILKYKCKNVEDILPGVAINFSAEKAFHSGIQGTVLDTDITGYVQKNFVDLKNKKPSTGQTIKARLLYTMPITKIPFFTTRNWFNEDSEETRLKIGEIIEDAKVIDYSHKSVTFKLGGFQKGTMTIRNIRVDENYTDKQIIAKIYPLGSRHKVRVTHYYLCDFMYLVSNDDSILSEKYVTYNDLEVGMLVDAKLKFVNDTGIQVKVGQLDGFVPSNQILDSGRSLPNDTVSKKQSNYKYKMGQSIKARVLFTNPSKNRLFLTMKPSFLDPKLEILKSIEKAVIGKRYKGYIHAINEKVIVGFFGEVRATVLPKDMCHEPIDNPTALFHVGEIVNCTILKVLKKRNTIFGSFIKVPFENGDAIAPTKDKPQQQAKTEVTEEDIGPKAGKKIKNKANTNKEQRKNDSTIVSDNMENTSHSTFPNVTQIQKNKYLKIQNKISALINMEKCVTKEQLSKKIATLIKAKDSINITKNNSKSNIEKLELSELSVENKNKHSRHNSDIVFYNGQIKLLENTLSIAQNKFASLEDIYCNNASENSKKRKHSIEIDKQDEEGKNKKRKFSSKKGRESKDMQKL